MKSIDCCLHIWLKIKGLGGLFLRVLLVLLVVFSPLSVEFGLYYLAPQTSIRDGFQADWYRQQVGKTQPLPTIKKPAGTQPFSNEQELEDFSRQSDLGKPLKYAVGGYFAQAQFKIRMKSAASKFAIGMIKNRFENADLTLESSVSEEYRQAGWENIDWNIFSDQVFEKINEKLEKIDPFSDFESSDDFIRIVVHDRGFQIGFRFDDSLPPLFAYTATSDEGHRVIHVTKEFIKRYAESTREEDRIFMAQVLFHEVIEDEVGHILSQFEGVDSERLKHPISTALEPLLELKGEYLSEEPPQMSVAQKRTLLYAAENNFTEYLGQTLEEIHPLDFGQRFNSQRKKYLFLLERLNALKKDGVSFQQSLDDFFESFSEFIPKKNEVEIEKLKFKFRVLNGKEITESFWTHLLMSFQLITYTNELTFDFSKEEVVRFLTPFLMEVFRQEADVLDLEEDSLVYNGPLSQCYKLPENRFLKVSQSEKAIKYLMYESEVYKTLIPENVEPSKYFIQSFDRRGPRVVKVNDEYVIALEMDYVQESISLKEYIRKHEVYQLAPIEVLSLFKQLLEAMAFLQEKGIVIRDTKPANILIVEVNGQLSVKVIDFGLAHFYNQDPFIVIPGTPLYYSPEEVSSKLYNQSSVYSHRQDLWKVGVTFYNLLSHNNFPFEVLESEDAPTAGTFVQRGAGERLRPILTDPLRELNDQDLVDPRLKALTFIVHHMLRSKDEKERYLTAKAVLEKIELLEEMFQKGVLETLMISDTGLETWNTLIKPSTEEGALDRHQLGVAPIEQAI